MLCAYTNGLKRNCLFQGNASTRIHVDWKIEKNERIKYFRIIWHYLFMGLNIFLFKNKVSVVGVFFCPYAKKKQQQNNPLPPQKIGTKSYMFDYTTTTKTCVHYSQKITIHNRGTTITENSEIFILKKIKLWVGWTKMMAAICILYNRNYLVKLYGLKKWNRFIV